MVDGIALRFDSVAYSAATERLLASVLAMPSTSLLARPGRRPGGGLEVTVGGTPESATAAPGGGIITDPAGGGSYVFVIPSSVVIALAARPSGGTSRIDEVIAVIKNVDVRPADGTREVDVQLLTGTAGSSPTAPTIPTGALRLAELAVPASGSVAISKPAQRIAALGGVVPVSSVTVRDAIEDIYPGLVAYREDAESLDVRIGAGWKALRQVIDTGWTSLGSNLTTGGINWRRIDDEIWVQVDGSFASTSGTDHTLTTAALPVGSRPSPPTGTAYRAAGYFGGFQGSLYVGTDGNVHGVQNTGANRATVSGLIKFPLG